LVSSIERETYVVADDAGIESHATGDAAIIADGAVKKISADALRAPTEDATPRPEHRSHVNDGVAEDARALDDRKSPRPSSPGWRAAGCTLRRRMSNHGLSSTTAATGLFPLAINGCRPCR
jgi:hypothetical protein